MVGGRDVGGVLRRDGDMDGVRRGPLFCHGRLGAASSPVETHVHLPLWNRAGGPGGPPEQLLGGQSVLRRDGCPRPASQLRPSAL